MNPRSSSRFSDPNDETSFHKRRRTTGVKTMEECCVAKPFTQGITVRVRTLTGLTSRLGPLYPTSTVRDIKTRIQEIEGCATRAALTCTGIPPPQQRLVFKGKALVNEMLVGAIGLQENDLLYIVLALRGGCQARATLVP